LIESIKRMKVIDLNKLSMMFFRKACARTLIRAWRHPPIESEDRLFGIMLYRGPRPGSSGCA